MLCSAAAAGHPAEGAHLTQRHGHHDLLMISWPKPNHRHGHDFSQNEKQSQAGTAFQMVIAAAMSWSVQKTAQQAGIAFQTVTAAALSQPSLK